jgi:hypothetical protein
MACIHIRVVTGAVVLLLAAPSHAQNDSAATDYIERCRTIADVMDRLACYDRIGAPDTAPATAPEAREDSMPETEAAHSDEGSQDPEAAVTATDDIEYGDLTDDVGLAKRADAFKPILVTVTRCSQANNRKWYFYLDNGQVWQYMGARTLRYRRCDTPGKLIEDSLGFSLQMDGDTAKHRVKRVR